MKTAIVRILILLLLSITAALGQTKKPPPLMISTITLSVAPDPSIGGSDITGTVTMSPPLPFSVTFFLVSNNADVQPPVSILIPANVTSSTFTLTSSVIHSQTEPYTISGFGSIYTAIPVTGTLTPIYVQSVDATTSIVGGGVMSATVTLNAPAPAGGAPVNFHAGSEILCPGSLSIPEGSTSQTFTFFTQGVDTDTAVPFGVSRENQEVDTGVLIQQASIVSVTPLASSVQGGAQDTCVITLSGNAGPSAYTPTVSSSDTDVIPNPTGVQLDPQTSQGAFRVNTNPVSTSTDVTLTVNDLIDYRTATITVTPAGPSFFSLAPDSVVGGQNLLATLALTGVSPTGGTSVSFSSVNNVIPASSGTVPAGESYAYIQLPTAAVTNSLNVLVTATVNGASLSSTVTVLPFQLSNATLQTPSVTCGNGELGEVYLTLPAPSQGVTVSLFSNDPAVQVPATVRILPGDLGVLFLVQTSLVNTQKTVTIKARVRTSVPGPTGVQTVTVVLQVNPII